LSQVRNSEPTVAVVVDGVLQTTGLGFSEELYDIEQVEVLKGPQGALYGRNASGGAINITTRQPTNELEAFARAGFGNGENKTFTGSVSGALVPNVLLGRAAVSLKDAEGWRENITLGRKADSYTDRSFRGRLLWRPSSALSGDVRVSYSNTEALQCLLARVSREESSYGVSLRCTSCTLLAPPVGWKVRRTTFCRRSASV
jgi:iron complex outermembrane receptor protein